MNKRIFLILTVLLMILSLALFVACNTKGNSEQTTVEQEEFYSIRYHLNGGLAENPISYSNQETFTLNNPTKEGYEFLGWTYDGETTPQLVVTIKKGTTGNLDFTANWTKEKDPTPGDPTPQITTYSITYKLNGGSATNPSTYTADTLTFTLNNPTKKGYTFTGWTYEGQTTPLETVQITKGSEGNKTFTANYSVITYSISYSLDGGSATNPSTYTVDTTTFTLVNPTKENYTFTGWTYEGQTTPLETITITKGSIGDLSYTANYTAIPTSYEATKIAVFADVQLCEKNLGATANAYLSLVNQLKYAKSINADVLLMGGDIINNAVESYYNLFETALTSVYGADETKYPEFVWIMGNHEWWNTSEKDTANAVSLFKQHARINTSNLVKSSSVKYKLDSNETIPSYYKVVNGVPFLAISAYDSSGKITAAEETEIKSWLNEISNLPSVKAGGPIYVAYHYAIQGVTYFGQGTASTTTTFDNIMKDYPNVIVFTGDTHYPSVNERTINQINYTSINMGSSSYSRMLLHSATSTENYYNLQVGSGKTTDKLIGEVQFMYEYIPNFMVIDFNSDASTKINRYITAQNVADVKHVGLEWTIPANITKAKFTYTDSRFKNTNWANTMYGADGLSWANSESVKFSVDGSKMMVYFNDVVDFNYCEHYIITVTADGNSATSKSYDFVSNYYKYDSTSHKYHCELSDIPSGSSYSVTVVAYDFFDNPSINSLTSSSIDSTVKFAEAIDVRANASYCDISKNINYEITAENSASSLEYYYRGTNDYSKSGAILFRVVMGDGKTVAVNELLSISDWSEGILKFKVKNPNSFVLKFGLSVVVDNGSGGEKWITDFGKEYQKEVAANSDWVEVKWNLKKEFNIDSMSDIKNLSVKVAAPGSVFDGTNGWTMSLYIDDLDVVENSSSSDSHEYAFKNSLAEDLTKSNLFEATTSQTLSFEYKLATAASTASNSNMAIMFFNGKDWTNYIGYVNFNPYSNTASNAACTITTLTNGWYKITIDLSTINVSGSRDIVDTYTFNSMYIKQSNINCEVWLDNFNVA